jgi:hypothetical protein
MTDITLTDAVSALHDLVKMGLPEGCLLPAIKALMPRLQQALDADAEDTRRITAEIMEAAYAPPAAPEENNDAHTS